MEEELKRILTEMREENAAAHLETRQYVDASLAEMRRENVAAHAETRQYVDASLTETRRENMAAHIETRQYVDTSLTEMRRENAEAHAETRRQLGVVAESLEHKIELVAEGVTATNERLDRLDVKVDRITDQFDARLTRLEAASFRSGR